MSWCDLTLRSGGSAGVLSDGEYPEGRRGSRGHRGVAGRLQGVLQAHGECAAAASSTKLLCFHCVSTVRIVRWLSLRSLTTAALRSQREREWEEACFDTYKGDENFDFLSRQEFEQLVRTEYKRVDALAPYLPTEQGFDNSRWNRINVALTAESQKRVAAAKAAGRSKAATPVAWVKPALLSASFPGLSLDQFVEFDHLLTAVAHSESWSRTLLGKLGRKPGQLWADQYKRATHHNIRGRSVVTKKAKETLPPATQMASSSGAAAADGWEAMRLQPITPPGSAVKSEETATKEGSNPETAPSKLESESAMSAPSEVPGGGASESELSAVPTKPVWFGMDGNAGGGQRGDDVSELEEKPPSDISASQASELPGTRNGSGRNGPLQMIDGDGSESEMSAVPPSDATGAEASTIGGSRAHRRNSGRIGAVEEDAESDNESEVGSTKAPSEVPSTLISEMPTPRPGRLTDHAEGQEGEGGGSDDAHSEDDRSTVEAHSDDDTVLSDHPDDVFFEGEYDEEDEDDDKFRETFAAPNEDEGGRSVAATEALARQRRLKEDKADVSNRKARPSGAAGRKHPSISHRGGVGGGSDSGTPTKPPLSSVRESPGRRSPGKAPAICDFLIVFITSLSFSDSWRAAGVFRLRAEAAEAGRADRGRREG